uniref:Glycosyltransferase 2-like domain-containing protein n=1 Tax=viral metagenome TaxID=1070528 RepID=A0A6C0EZF5_9ZZZZ
MVLEEAQQYALCLNMIVKDESHIIKDTLKKLLQKINFDYWVISDTGSTDETMEIITEFFKEVGIPGELYQDEWVDFSHNRNKALDYAFGKSKYLLIFDADDEVCGDFVLPELVKDSYQFQFGSYTRTQIVNNNKRWKYLGVLHECIVSNDDRIDGASMEIIKGSYYTVSGRSGNRNLDSNKYLKDAIILEKAYYNAVDVKDDIYNRYCFYCANSYYDCDKYEHAISWYKKTLECGGWAQEKYVSCLKLYKCYEKMNNKESGFFYLVKSAEYDKERAECYYELIKYYSALGLRDVAYGYYGVLRDFYRDTYLKDGLNHKLFLDESISEFYLPYYVIIVSEKMRDYDTGIQMYRIVFTKKCKCFDEWFVGNLLYNLQFFTERVKDEDKTAFYSLFQEYVDFLVANNYPLFDETMKIYEKYGIKKKEASIATHDECLTSKKILIYIGFMDYLWNDTYVSNNAIGGAEKAVAYLARNLPKEYEIIISGDVADEVVGNVKYVNRFKLQALLDVEKFHTIIVSRYVSFFLLFPRFNCHQLYLSAHDTGFLNNLNDVPVRTIIEENNKYINGVICLTTWHKLNMIQNHACLKDKVSIINNGIMVPVVGLSDGATSNKKMSHNKIKNKFAWTSCSNRGLDLLLKLWDEILEVMPDATLDISSYDAFPNPNRNNDEEIQMIINRHSDSVKHHGKLNTLQLHELISKAEYWLYTTTFCETSCITALEMLMHEVVCLYYPLAGLTDTIGKYGIQVNSGTEIETIMNLSEAKKVEMRINGKKYAMSCSWENRAKEWASVLGLSNQRVYDLHNNYTIPQNHINYLKKLKYNFQPKTIYDIGANVLNWTKEAKKVWNDADIIVFDAIKSAEFLYKEHNYKYHIGVLSDTDDKIVKFYENSEHPAGNSYYKEVGHEKSNELYPENNFTEYLCKTLATVVKKNNFPLPDLIKFDVQGCELDIIKGSIDIINHARYLIVELQTTEYNKGAPLADETIKFLEDNNWELLTKTPFCDNGPDGDYCFKNNRTINKQKWVFYTGSCIYTPIVQYLENYASNEIEIEISNDVNYIVNMKFDKLIIILTPFGRGLLDKNILNQFNHISISFLQLEPLNLYTRLNDITNEFNSHPDLKKYSIYDYSKSNIKILNDNGITKCKHLPYKCTPSELNLLRKCNSSVKEYDFGFIYDWKMHNNGLKSLPIRPPRRNKIMEFLINNGFTVNLIAGYGEDRDTELGKCKIILNPHGQINENPTPSPSECSNIFEHIRCDRLLEAGFTIMSETSYDLCPEFVQKYPNLKLIEYEDFFNLDVIRNILTKKWYCFIHSCHLNGKGLNRLDYLMTSLKKNDLFSKIETIYINNIGLPVEENRYGTMVDICNYSDNPMLCEIPTINKIQHFSQTNPDCNILYLHTKGICYDDNNQKINDWIDMMLYFLVEKYELCISKLDSGIQTVGCNYFDVKNPPHFSGNFWWSKSSYINTLPLLIESEFAYRNDAEFWLCKNNPTVYELHNSKIDQYFELYPPTMYRDDKQKIDVFALKIYIIHYKKLIDRKVSILSQLTKCNITNYEFIEIDRDELTEYDTDIFHINFGTALTAISLSHFYAFKDIAANHNNALIFEDDVILCDDFMNRLSLYMNQLPDDYDILFIGDGCAQHIENSKLEPGKYIYEKSLYPTNGPLGNINGAVRCADSYILSKKCASSLCKYIYTSKNKINMSIDAWLDVAARDNIFHVYWAEPTIVTQGSQNGLFERSWYNESTDQSIMVSVIKNLTCITCDEMCEMFQNNDTLIGSDNIIFCYGIDNKHVDITNIVLSKCITNNKIVIPGGDDDRAFIFGDPMFGIIKCIYMIVNFKYCKITYDYHLCVDIFNKKCNISNSINPSALTVYKPPFEKMRLGKDNDGGYVICDIQNISYDLLLSCGISDDISFEEFFCNKYNTTACYAFDGTIENINIINKNISFFRQNINNYNDDKNTNLHSTIEMFDNIFLKMDIEGYEIPWIKSLDVKHLNKFSQIVIEFHFPFSYKEVHAFDILNETHILVHFHANNCCGVRNHKGVFISNVFECTYVHKRHYPPPYVLNTDIIPGVLDMKNVLNNNEIIIDYEPFVFKCINTHNIVLNQLYNHYSSAWLGHMHFACWLVRLLIPCVVVDLGVDFGHSTFAFAAAKLGCVYGIDSFEGDMQAGIKNTYNIVHDLKTELIRDNLLIDNIHFIRGYFDDVYNTFDKTIDILHIDGLHTLDAVTNDYNTWITKTSDNAVILFHDVVSYPDTVGKLFNSIQYPKFYFTHSAGLGVVCKNSHTLNKILTSADIPNKEFIIHDKSNKMIVDCFTFYNELDMLTYRLNILDKVVDYFVLVESTHTHVGKEKPLFYNENKYLFEKFNHKIIHIVVDDFPHKYPNINIEKQEQWINERFQRDCISRGIDKLNLTGEDIITITDLDEIPNPNTLTQIKNNIIVVGINIIELDFYYYNLNSKMDHKWYHSKILTFEKYKELNTGCDNIRFYNCPIINNAGWHLSYFGNEKFIKNKLENFTHQEFNMSEFTNENRIKDRVKNGQDLFNRPNAIIHINIEDNNNLPPDYDIYLKNYYNICYEDEKVEVKLNLNKKEMDLNKFNNGSGVFIQIGAGAGDLDERANCRDGFTELVKKLPRQSIKKIILVEPNPLNIPLLKECWKDYPESIIYEIGIVPKNYQDNTIDLYYCPLDAPHYQVASINKSHVQKHYGDNCEIEKFIIPVKQLETFINEITTEEIELLALDIEGIDAEILLDINFNNLKLKYLSFEHLHLGEYKENVLNHLKNNNYEFVGSGVDHNGYDYLYINGHYMSITLFGTCRLNNIHNHNGLNNLINYSHSTKEVIQFINFLKGELSIPNPYNKLCFRTAICDNKFIDYNDTYNKLFINTDIFIIEICSNKKYIHNGFFLHHLCVDKRFSGYNKNTPHEILNNFIIEKQSDEEIENDILEIQKMLYPKKIIIVSHYNSKQNGEYINSRNNLINLLDRICKKYDIPFINPTIILANYTQEQVISSDLGHYTDFGINEFSNYINNFLKSAF